MSLHWKAARELNEGESFRLKGLHLTDRRYAVPLDYTGALGGEIVVFMREVVSADAREANKSLPCVLYLQGGPGFESPRLTEAGGFVGKLARDHRVLLLDQRGTGLSTPVAIEALDSISVAERVAYLRCFRADSIVRDAELIRHALLGESNKWLILGQSFGGFCCLTYLSQFPWALDKVLITGGLAPVSAGCSAITVYSCLARRVQQQMERYYEEFPADENLLREIVLYIARQEDGVVPLPSGSVLSVRGLQAIGFSCLGFPGSFSRLHYLLERAWITNRVSGEQMLSYYFLKSVDEMLSFDTNPMYFLMHEAIYCNSGEGAMWAAERVLRDKFPQFDATRAAQRGQPVYLTGEMVFPFMLDEFAALRPWKETALAIADIQDWTPLYSAEALKKNTVPTAAVAYYNDLFVDFDLSMVTAKSVTNMHVWITNEFTHSGLRENCDLILDTLLDMVRGKCTLER